MLNSRVVMVVLAAVAFSASVVADTAVQVSSGVRTASAGANAAPTPDPDATLKSAMPIDFSAVIGSRSPVLRELKPRTALPKRDSASIVLPLNGQTLQHEVTGRVIVKFHDDIKARAPRQASSVIQRADGSALSSASLALQRGGGGVVWQAIERSTDELAQLELRAMDRSGTAAPDLAGILYVVPADDDLVACAKAFNDLPEVEFVVIEQMPFQAQQVGAQNNCGSAPGDPCQAIPGSVNCNKPGITSAPVGPPPWMRCTGLVTGSSCSDACDEPCVDMVDDFNCMLGCNDTECCGAINAFLPACIGAGHGWDGLCAAYANTMCDKTVFDTLFPVSGNSNSVPGAFKYDPCFALRTGPNPGMPDFSIQATYASALPVTPLGAVSFPFELVQVSSFSVAVAPPPMGDSGLVTGVVATGVNPAFPSSAQLAMQDPSFERAPYEIAPTCFTIAPGRKGCNNTPCCTYVCIIDPSCCVNSWDSACVKIASTIGANNPCIQPLAGSIPASVTPGPADFPTLSMASFPAGGSTPNFKGTVVATPFGNQARNLQTWNVGAPVASNLEALQQDPAVGLFAVARPTSQAQLSSSRMFLNSGFRGGGLDLAGYESAAAAVGVGTPEARGQGITIGIIDNSAYVAHEDFASVLTVEPGVPIVTTMSGSVNPNHGTAVIGILLAQDNGKGITGVAPNAKGVFFPAFAGGAVGGRFFNALASAINTLKAGDVICVPLDFPTLVTDPLTGQTTALVGTVLQSEEVFLLATLADQLGISMVVAAGNECSGVVTSPGGPPSNAVVVGACWPGAQRFPGVFQGLYYCRSDFSNFSQEDGTQGSNEVDVAGWGAYVTTCGYGDLWRGNNSSGDPNLTNNLRTYTMQFGGTSAAAAMVAGCAARMQSTSNAIFGTPLTTSQLKSSMRANIRPQCGFALDSPLQLYSAVPCMGDTTAGGGLNEIRGFLDMGPALLSTLANQPFGPLPEGVSGIEVQILIGKLLSGSVYSIRANDSSWMKVQAQRARGSQPTAGFGPAIFYPPTAVLTDLLVTITTTFTQPEEIYGLAVAAFGQAQPGSNVYTVFYVYNVQTQRWLLLPDMLQFFTDTDEPEPDGDVPIMSGQISDLYNVINLMDLSSGVGKIRVRAVTVGPPIVNTYQAWWDLLAIEPNPPLQPPPPCWVAQSVYGMSSPKWILFREWLDQRASTSFREAYMAFGQPTARWLDRSPTARAIVRPVLDAAIATLSEDQIARAMARFAATDTGRQLRTTINEIQAPYWEDALR